MGCAEENLEGTVRIFDQVDATWERSDRKAGMPFTMFDLGCDLLRMANLALTARGFETMGQNFPRVGIDLVEGGIRQIEAFN